ncbi:unnamed protein product [Chrysoparadoxa australica]
MDKGDAAVRIQAIQRGRTARSNAAQRQEKVLCAKREREKAAMRIQSIARGRHHRDKAAHAKAEKAASIKIQSIQRGKLARKKRLQEGGCLELTVADIKRGLHTLGRNPHDLRYCFVACNLHDQGLCKIDAIRGYPLLQSLDISQNHVSNLSVLGALPFLHELNAGHNEIQAVLDYEVLKGENYSWTASDEALSSWQASAVKTHSLLYTADLSGNLISSMAGAPLHHHKLLQSLDISHNSITVIESLSNLSCLTHLNLSFNKIEGISGLEGLPLVHLDLSHNCMQLVRDVDAMQLPHLQRLYLGHNQIRSLSGLRHSTHLIHLDVAHNCISAARQAEFLRGIPFLSSLNLSENPVNDEQWYRLRVIVHLQGITSLDGTAVQREEKVKAINLMNKDGGELAHRKEVFARVFSGGEREWENLLPPVPEPEPDPEEDPAVEAVEKLQQQESHQGSAAAALKA